MRDQPDSQPRAGARPEAFSGPDRIYAFADSLAPGEPTTGERIPVPEALETWVTFGLAGESFAIPAGAVLEVLRVTTITRVPHAPYTVRGIVNMRGRVLPVVDLRLRLGLPRAEPGPKSRIMVMPSRGRLIGLLVDSVHEVTRLRKRAIEAPPPDVMTEQSEYIVGVYHLGADLVILLDVERILQIPDSLQALARS